MPRNSAHKYISPNKVVEDALAAYKIDAKAINRVLIDAVNNNRIRIIGKLCERSGDRDSLTYPASGTSTEISKPISRSMFLEGFWVVPGYFPETGIRSPSLADKWSNIYLGPKGKSRYSMVIEDAQLLKSDVDRVVSEVFNWPGSGITAGRKRSPALWGRVIVHLLNLQKRGAVQVFASTSALVTSITSEYDDIDEPTIKPVLDVVVRLLSDARQKTDQE